MGRDKMYGGAGDDSLNGEDGAKQVADLVDGGANVVYGDFCYGTRAKRVNCER